MITAEHLLAWLQPFSTSAAARVLNGLQSSADFRGCSKKEMVASFCNSKWHLALTRELFVASVLEHMLGRTRADRELATMAADMVGRIEKQRGKLA